ncbi:MAG: GUN4 domain-containing protein [Hassallia sp. WJT32-NPBG1]|nr:GUN4 domain-containing protein [Hassallia sp. WJT32-NPBG1]
MAGIQEHLTPQLLRKEDLHGETINTTLVLTSPPQDARKASVISASPTLTPPTPPVTKQEENTYKYRQKVEEFASDGVIDDDIESHILNDLQKKLGLTDEQACAVTEEVLEPYKIYKQQFNKKVAEQGYPLREKAEAELKKLQNYYEIKDEFVNLLKEEGEQQEAEKLREEEVQKLQRQREEEAEKLRQEHENNLRRYEEELLKAVQAQYPLDEFVRDELKKFQQSLGLRDEDVAQIEKPILDNKEVEYQEKLRQQQEAEKLRQQQESQKLQRQREQEEAEQKRQEHENNLRRYEEELLKVVQAQYPLDEFGSNELKKFQQSLGLRDEDVAQIEKPILDNKEVEYQEKLRQQQEAEKLRQQQESQKLQRQREQEEAEQKRQEHENNLRRYEEELLKAVQAQYPLDEFGSNELKKFQQSLGLRDEDVAQIEKPILDKKEVEYQEKLRQQQEAEKLRQQEEAQRLQRQREEQEAEQKRQEYENNLRRYEQKLLKAVKTQYPLHGFVRNELKKFQQSLGLRNEDVAQIEKPILGNKELEYQGKLRQQQEAEKLRQQEEAQRLQRQREQQEAEKLRQEHENNLRRYEEELLKVVQAQYPLDEFGSNELKKFQQFLGVRDEDVAQIEKPILDNKEVEYQEKLRQQQEAEKRRQRKQKKAQRLQRQKQQTDDLPSEKGVDYTKLRDLLAAGKWKDADQETLAVMLKATGREEDGYLDSQSIENFPCTDLRTIDQIRIQYSKGLFGFCVQKRIYDSVGKDEKSLGDRVGWRKGMFFVLKEKECSSLKRKNREK